MTTYEGDIQQLHCNAEYAFAQLTDLRKLEIFKDKLPADKIKNLQLTEETISFTVDPVGEIILRIIEKEPYKTVKFGADKSPIQFNLWIKLKEISECDTRMKVTLKADIPMMLKPMIGSKLDEMVKQITNGIAMAVNKSI